MRSSALVLMFLSAITVLTIDGSAQRAGRRVAGGGNSGKRPAATRSENKQVPDGKGIKGVTTTGEMGVQRVNAEVQQTMLFAAPSKRPPLKPERETRDRDDPKAANPFAPNVAQWPIPAKGARLAAPSIISPSIHTVGTSFDGATLTDTGAFPPDSMGAVGPTQYIAFENGRIRSFTKAGAPDAVMNADPDVFFASVMTPVSPPVVLNFTSDPQIRYDRFTGRWYMSIIDVPCTNATCTTTAANRWMIAVSDAASNGTISGSTVWTFFSVQTDPANFCDYPSLGVDVSALYFGCNMFTGAGSFVGTNGYVVRKSSILGAGPITFTAFANMALGAGAGPESPRGVDNYDPAATEGYFVGPDNATFSTIMFRRVSNPGALTPTMSANISVIVPTTTISPTNYAVDHAGNTGGNNGRIDMLDDRFFAAMIRNGRLWSAHNFTVSAAGVASTSATSRTGVRWYEFQNLTTTPTVVQSGTVFDNAATRALARQYSIPSVAVTGQGHSVLGMTMAGTPVGTTPAFVGRLSGDTLGTMTGPPTDAAVPFGTTTANYNPPSDPGGGSGRRWGDYSYTTVDPIDDMTVWTIQEYNQALNSYAVRVARLLAPLPATPTSAAPSSVNAGIASTNIVVTGTSTAGSGFYDPGANLAPPALPFSHIAASFTGGVTVNSVTYNTPTQITINVSTVGASGGQKNLTVNNPDGQSVTANNFLTVNVLTAAGADISGRVLTASGGGVRNVLIKITDGNGFLRTAITNSFGYYTLSGIPTGASYVITPSAKGYGFDPANTFYNHVDTFGDMNFTAGRP
jgi:hypothetical protein